MCSSVGLATNDCLAAFRISKYSSPRLDLFFCLTPPILLLCFVAKNNYPANRLAAAE